MNTFSPSWPSIALTAKPAELVNSRVQPPPMWLIRSGRAAAIKRTAIPVYLSKLMHMVGRKEEGILIMKKSKLILWWYSLLVKTSAR